MARPPRIDIGGYCYHVLNRANARYRMFKTEEDFAAFEREGGGKGTFYFMPFSLALRRVTVGGGAQQFYCIELLD